ncbi:porin [Franzmannia qiaohouensis]|uniref:Porin n=1 Tax=Franzmannia qiaohouensis TaxID=1329370 RepID=A0ABU1HKQ1_9GAMM|nr:porin [Halomonas qiaohouensis]MDR5907170.1 porin [Halomonas qiaohouensis]
MLRKQPHLKVLVTLLACGLSMAAQAATPSLSLDGFGTLGAVYSDEARADHTSSIFAARGAGYSSDWSAEVDSRLGLQLSAEVTPRLSGVVQAISEQRYDGSYQPTIEWANLKYHVTPDLSVRAGRLMLPVFMNAEYRKVGYALPWVRTPQEVYSSIPISNIDGVDISYRFRLGEVNNTLRATYGQTTGKFPYIDQNGERATGAAVAREGFTLGNNLEWQNLRLFTAYTHYRLSIEELTPFFDIYRAFGPDGEAIADRYDMNDKRFDVFSLGANYDTGNWFVMGEWTQSSSRTFVGDSRGWYITHGYRLGSITPYVTYARHSKRSPTSVAGLSQPGTEVLDATLNYFTAYQDSQTRFSLGARWDFARGMNLKAQIDHIDLDAGSNGYLTNRNPAFEPGGSVNLFSLALDFVF